MIHLIELKSAEKYSIMSLRKFGDKFKDRIGQAYVIDTKNYCWKDDMVNLLAYITMCL